MTRISNSSGSWLHDKGQMWVLRQDHGTAVWCRSVRARSVSHVAVCVDRDEALQGIVKSMWASSSSSSSSRFVIKDQNASFTFRFFCLLPHARGSDLPLFSPFVHTTSIRLFWEKKRNEKKEPGPLRSAESPLLSSPRPPSLDPWSNMKYSWYTIFTYYAK